MRAIFVCAFVVLVVALCAVSGVLGSPHAAAERVRLPGDRTRITGRIARRPTAASGQQPLHLLPRATDGPVDQPHGMIVSIQIYCQDQWNLTYSKAYTSGWEVAPATIIYGANSGHYVLGFEGEADPGSDVINCSVTYASRNSWQLAMAFAAVRGEWEYMLESPTALNATLASADVGRKAVYTIVVGDPYAETPQC